jgi:hypothetical protein
MSASRRDAAADAERCFNALPDIGWPTFEWLVRQRVPASALFYPEMPKRARIVHQEGAATFDWAKDLGEEGDDALVFLARDDLGEPADLVAWTVRPARLARLWGAVSLLGAETLIGPRICDQGALPVHRSALGWLRGDRFGVVLINPQKAASEIRDFGPFAAEDEAHGRELSDLLRGSDPQVYVPERRAA